MRNYFPKRPSGAPLHSLSKFYDVPVGFLFPLLFWSCVLLYLLSPKGGCCSKSDDLSCSFILCLKHTAYINAAFVLLFLVCLVGSLLSIPLVYIVFRRSFPLNVCKEHGQWIYCVCNAMMFMWYRKVWLYFNKSLLSSLVYLQSKL